MYKCKNCGEDNDAQERFCTKCGAYIGEPLRGQEVLIDEINEQEENKKEETQQDGTEEVQLYKANMQEGNFETAEKVNLKKKNKGGLIKVIGNSENLIYETLKNIVKPYNAFNKEQNYSLLSCLGSAIISSLIFALINTVAASAAFLSPKSYLNACNKLISFISIKGFMVSEGYSYIFLNSLFIFLLSSIFLFCISYLFIYYAFKKDCSLTNLYVHIVNSQNVFILGIAIGSCFYAIAPASFNIIILLYSIQFILLFKDALEKNFNIQGTKILYTVPILLMINAFLINVFIEFFVS